MSVTPHVTAAYSPVFISVGNADPLAPQSVALAGALRSLMYGMLLSTGMAVAGASAVSAAPANGLVIDQAANSALLSEPVHCKKYLPHRHRGAKPHGLGFGCGKTVRRAKAKRS
jgi:hypothetical protein